MVWNTRGKWGERERERERGGEGGGSNHSYIKTCLEKCTSLPSSLQGEWVSMGVMSDGSYGTPKGVIYSFPVRTKPDHTWEIVQGLPISDFAREKMDKTGKELEEEKETALAFLSSSS